MFGKPAAEGEAQTPVFGKQVKKEPIVTLTSSAQESGIEISQSDSIQGFGKPTPSTSGAAKGNLFGKSVQPKSEVTTAVEPKGTVLFGKPVQEATTKNTAVISQPAIFQSSVTQPTDDVEPVEQRDVPSLFGKPQVM